MHLRTTLRAVVAFLLLLTASGALVAPPAAAAVPAYVRLAHLSPDTPEVDVYLTSFRGGSFSKVLPGVAYGTLSDYQRLSPGSYAVAMRPPGAAGSSEPLIRTTLRVQRGKSYTVAGIGRNAELALRVLTDDLSRPSKGKARMRVVQASSVAPVVDVSTTTGVPIAQGAEFPSSTPYSEVGAQQWTLRVQPQDTGIDSAEETVQVKAGAIYTALVLDEGDEAVQLVVRADAAASASAPVGSVNTGLGGGADPAGTQVPAWLLAVVAASLCGFTLIWVRRPAPA